MVLLDDNDHTYDYVIEMLQQIFIFSLDQAYRHAEEVDRCGRTVLITCELREANSGATRFTPTGGIGGWSVPRGRCRRWWSRWDKPARYGSGDGSRAAPGVSDDIGSFQPRRLATCRQNAIAIPQRSLPSPR
ncbi:MAG: ATP-dependent Clp protease adaptor ClpS [Ignavibacteriota bacterium]